MSQNQPAEIRADDRQTAHTIFISEVSRELPYDIRATMDLAIACLDHYTVIADCDTNRDVLCIRPKDRERIMDSVKLILDSKEWHGSSIERGETTFTPAFL